MVESRVTTIRARWKRALVITYFKIVTQKREDSKKEEHSRILTSAWLA
jgi:hypothetical protein